MKLIVTGGAGFIGTNFVFYIKSKYPDYEIAVIDKLTYAGSVDTLTPIMGRDNFRFYQADICDRSEIERIFAKEKADIVVNFAAESHVDRSIEEPEIFLQTNLVGCSVLLDAAMKYGVKRFHQISTDEVYGELPLERADLSFNEQSPINPSSPYSASKAAADLLVLAYHRTYGCDVTISRCSNNYGMYQFPEKLVPLMIINGLKGNPLPIYGNGLNVRDWIYVQDHCEAVDKIIHFGKSGEIYNVGGGCEKQNIEVVRLICDIIGADKAKISYVADRKGHDLRYAINSDKLKNELGWSPKTDFNSGMKMTAEWYLNNRQWWENKFDGGKQSEYQKSKSR